LNGNIVNIGGTLSTTGSGNITVGGAGTIVGNFPVTTGTFNHVNFNRARTFALASNLSANKLTILTAAVVNATTNTLTLTGTDATSGRLGEGTLNITGNTTFGGTFAQTLDGINNLKNVNINSTHATGLTASAASNTSVTGLVTFGTNAKLNVTSGGLFTLKHNSATERSSIAAMPLGSQINGNVSVEQRYFTNTTGWYFVGMPIKSRTIADLTSQFQYRGVPGASGFFATGDPSIYFFNEPTSSNNGWVAATGTSNQISSGFRTWLDLNFFVHTKKLTFAGSVNVGDGVNQTESTGTETYSFPVTRTNGGGFGGGWNLISNPYPSNILLDNSSNWTSSNVSPILHFWDAQAGTYVTYNRTDGTGSKGNGFVALGQAFLVQATDAGPSLGVKEGAKTASNTSLLRQGQVANQLMIKLGQDNNTRLDLATINLNQSASGSYDANFDAPNLNGGYFDVASVSAENYELALNAIDMPAQYKVIPLVYSSYLGAGTTLKLEFEGIDSFNGLRFYLIDRLTGTNTLISEGSIYPFNQDGASRIKISNRFALGLAPTGPTSIEPDFSKSVGVNLYPNPTSTSDIKLSLVGADQAKVTVFDAAGKVLGQQTVDNSANQKLNFNLIPGIYQVSIEVSGNIVRQKLVIQ
jgi:hypothetical protein